MSKNPEIIDYLQQKSIIDNMPMDPAASNTLLRKTEAQKYTMLANVEADQFSMMVPAEKAKYIKLLNDVANKKKEVKFIDRFWNDKDATMNVYVEWVNYTITNG